VTWGEFDVLVDTAAAALLRLGLTSGDRVALALANGLDFPTAYFGALRAGLVVVPVNPAYTNPELVHILSDSGSAAILGAGDLIRRLEVVRSGLPSLRHLITVGTALDTGPALGVDATSNVGTALDTGPAPGVGNDAKVGPSGRLAWRGLMAEAERDFPATSDGVARDVSGDQTPADASAASEAPISNSTQMPGGTQMSGTQMSGGEDLAVLMYTSGTTGRPKGAMLSHRAMLANLDQCASIQPPVVSADDVVLLVLPLFHVYGLNPGLGMVARSGCTGILVERFDPVGSLALMQRHGVTSVAGAPPMYLAWSLLPEVADAFTGVRLAVSGAAPLNPDAQARLLEVSGHHVFEGYGLTETAPVLTSTLLSEVAKPGSIGRPIPGVELRLVDAAGAEVGAEGEDEEISAGSDEPGEILVRGANLFSGYWPRGTEGPDAQGWWATGDLAYADDDGDLFLVDRVSDLVLVSGFNVYPREVESVLLAHPAIADAAVIGITHPYTGETVKAYVITAPGTHLSAAEVIAHCELSLARFKCPTSVEFVGALPHSAAGKVRKAELRAALGSRSGGES
jgi:long-chain acyl-CoA synthetase